MFTNSYFAECFNIPKTEEQINEEHRAHQQHKEEISSLPLEQDWQQHLSLRLYKGFWFPETILPGVLSLPHRLRPVPSDIILAGVPKSGTTWLKAIVFAIATRNPEALVSRHPQDCSPNMEVLFSGIRAPDLDVLQSPRKLSTHIPYSLLPKSVHESPCRIIYICREPKDMFVSTYHFVNGLSRPGADVQPLSLLGTVDRFCNGLSMYGPVWEHQLEYWRESERRPEKVMFVKYEDMKADPEANVKRIADFVGMPFSTKEEMSGVVARIVGITSFEKISEFEVNKVGVWEQGDFSVKSSSFFRKGKVGDWKEHLSMEMAERIDAITRNKLHQTGLTHSV